MSLKKIDTIYLGLAKECEGGGSATQIALLSVTTAPSGSFAVGSKYYNSSTKKIVTAVTANTWVGATSADGVFGIIYFYDAYDDKYYVWDGDNLVVTDLERYQIKNISNNYNSPSEDTYPSSYALSAGLATKEPTLAPASNTVAGKIRIATDAEVATGTSEALAINPKQLADGLASKGSYTSMKFFSPTGAGDEDGSSWANAMEFTQANYDGLEDNIACFLLAGSYTIGLEFTNNALNPIYGGFTGIELENVNSAILTSDNVVGETGTTTFSPQSTVFNGEATYRIMTNVVGGYINNVVFYQGLKTGGNQGKGGGVYNQGTLINCKIVNCRACNGGGIYSDSSISGGGTTATYTIDCEIVNCLGWYDSDGTAPQGGGICCNEVANNYITNCTIKNCHSKYAYGLSGGSGGGVFLGTATNCKTIDCSAIRSGGGFYRTKVTNCESFNCYTYSNESGTGGGGLFIEATESPVLNYKATNCTTTQYGGGIFLEGGSPTLSKCDLINCSADYEGGAIYCNSSTPTLTACSANGCYAPTNPQTNYGTLVDSFNNTTMKEDIVPLNLNTKYAVNAGHIDSFNKEKYVDYSFNFTNTGVTIAGNGIATGGSGKYLTLPTTLGFGTATSFIIDTGEITYASSAGEKTIFGYTGGIDFQAPLLMTNNNILALFVSSAGTTWDLFLGVDTGITLVNGNKYRFKLIFDSVTKGYSIDMSIDDGKTWTVDAWVNSSPVLTPPFCSVPLMLMNLGLNTDSYYMTGTLDISNFSVTIDGTEVYNTYNPKSLTLKANTVFTSSDDTDTIGTEYIKDMTSEADGHYEMYITAGRALEVHKANYYISKNAPTLSNTVANDYWLHNIEPLQLYFNDNGTTITPRDYVHCGSFDLTSGVISNLWIRPLNDNGTNPILVSSVTDTVNVDVLISKVFENTVIKYGTIDSLEITSVEVSDRQSIIYFSTSASFTTFTPPTAQAFIGSGSVVAEKSYKIIIENGIMQVLEYGVPA